MKSSQTFYGLLPLFIAMAIPCAAAPQTVPPPTANPHPAAQAAKQLDLDQSSEAYLDYAMGHYYQQEYEVTGHADDANKSIDFYKKAYAVDPNSQQIGNELAEMYFQCSTSATQCSKAQSMITKDPNNLSARQFAGAHLRPDTGRLERHFRKKDTLARATEQYHEILRIDPTDSDAALWLAKPTFLQNQHDQAEAVLRTLLAREPENENGVEQLTQLLLDEGKSEEAISSLQQILQRAPTGRLWDMLGDAYNQVHDLPNAEQAYRKAADFEPDEITHRRGLAQTLLGEEKYPEALERYPSAWCRWTRTIRTTTCVWPRSTGK